MAISIAKYIRTLAQFHESRGNYCKAAEFIALAAKFEKGE